MTTTDAINKVLNKFPKAKKIAVQNFVGTAGNNSLDNMMNVDMDARLYGWNKDTVKAITEGLILCGKVDR